MDTSKNPARTLLLLIVLHSFTIGMIIAAVGGNKSVRTGLKQSAEIMAKNIR